MAALSPKQERFCQEYPKDLNATQAAIRAGYSARTARSVGSENLAKPDIGARISALLSARAERTETTVDQVLSEVDALALSDIGDIVEFNGDQGIRFRSTDQIPERARRAIASVKVRRYPHRDNPSETYELVEFKLWDKNAALRLALQHRGLLTERHELTGKNGTPLGVVHSIMFGDQEITF